MYRRLLIFAMFLIATAAVASTPPEAETTPSATSLPDHGTATATAQDLSPERMAFDRDADGAVLPALTIEGEDKVSIRFERPEIELDLLPRTAPGLDWTNTWDRVDLFPVATRLSALETSPFVGHPWLDGFAAEDVVVFHPAAENADTWRLTVVDSRGREAISFTGEGRPPVTIAWDGRRADGTPAWPGLIYTHVLEIVDRAGNRRTVTGDGFELPPFRLMEEDALQLVFDGSVFPRSRCTIDPQQPRTEELMIEAASWLNQVPDPEKEIEIRATARTAGQARRLAEQAARSLDGRVIGPRRRIVQRITTVSDAPDQGLIVIAAR